MIGYQPRQSAGVHDKIFHRVLVLDDGRARFYLVASDLCLFSPSVYEEVAERLNQELGVEPGHMWWTVTHTHAAPEVGPPLMYRVLLGRSDHEWSREYAHQVTNALLQGAREATAKLEDARIAIGSGISMANINRRAKDLDGTVTLGLNPDGPVDRQIGLLSIEKSDHSPLAVVANYAMHGTVLSGENLQIGGDAPGVVEAYVEEKIGVPTLYVNGAAGNVAPIYSVYPDPQRGHLSQFRVLLGDRILAGLKELGPSTGDVKLTVSDRTVDTPRKAGLSWPEELGRYTGQSEKGTPLVRVPIHFLRINDTLIWSAPVELFCEMAISVRNASPFPHTFYFGYANGWLGYLPTKQGFQEGGYEPRTSPFTEQAEKDLMQTVVTYILGEANRR